MPCHDDRLRNLEDTIQVQRLYDRVIRTLHCDAERDNPPHACTEFDTTRTLINILHTLIAPVWILQYQFLRWNCAKKNG